MFGRTLAADMTTTTPTVNDVNYDAFCCRTCTFRCALAHAYVVYECVYTQNTHLRVISYHILCMLSGSRVGARLQRDAQLSVTLAV